MHRPCEKRCWERNSTRDLKALRSGLSPRCLSSCSMSATTTQKIQPSDFLLTFPRTAKAQYKLLVLLGVTSLTMSVPDGGGGAPDVPILPMTQSTTVVKDMGLRCPSSASCNQTSTQLTYAKKMVHILPGDICNVGRFPGNGSRRIDCRRRGREENGGAKLRPWEM